MTVRVFIYMSLLLFAIYRCACETDISQKESREFSGVYIPSNLNAEYFGGALLMDISRLLRKETMSNIYGIQRRGIEQVLLAVLFYNTNAMTRDYLDFQVIPKCYLTSCIANNFGLPESVGTDNVTHTMDGDSYIHDCYLVGYTSFLDFQSNSKCPYILQKSSR